MCCIILRNSSRFIRILKVKILRYNSFRGWELQTNGSTHTTMFPAVLSWCSGSKSRNKVWWLCDWARTGCWRRNNSPLDFWIGRIDMRYISTETQRKIMLIPLVNMANIFICLNNNIYMHANTKLVLKSLVYLFCYTLQVGFLWMLICSIVPTMADILYPLMMYVMPLCMSYGLIKYQEKYFGEDNS